MNLGAIGFVIEWILFLPLSLARFTPNPVLKALTLPIFVLWLFLGWPIWMPPVVLTMAVVAFRDLWRELNDDK